jgi:nucleoside-diphosphate-sugar epimerase
MSRVLVTGATGFVGPALVEALLAAGHRVRVALRRDAALLPGVEYTMTGGVGPATDWRPALLGISAVVHLAARAHVTETGADALERFRAVNSAGTRHLAEAAAAAGVRRFVFLSSVKAMGESSLRDRALTEADTPAPEDAYGISKREGEIALLDVAASSGLEPVILRAPLVYGPGVKGNFLRLMRLVDRGIPLPFGAVANRRSLVARANLAAALALCLRHPDAAGETFLVADGEDLSTPELIRRLARALERPARLFPLPPALLSRVGRLIGREPEIARLTGDLAIDSGTIRARLGWQPVVAVDEALAETAAWYRSRR